MATPKGLVTPVVRNAESMSFVEIEKEIAALGKKARDGKLTLEDMAGGSFTMCVYHHATLLEASSRPRRDVVILIAYTRVARVLDSNQC